MSSPYNQPPHEQPPPYNPNTSYRHPRWRTRGVGFGVLLIVLGVWALLQNLGLLGWIRWDVFWPLVLIAFGLFVIARRVRWP